MNHYLRLIEYVRLLDHDLLTKLDARLTCSGLVALKYKAYRPLSVLTFLVPIQRYHDLIRALNKRPQGFLAAEDKQVDFSVDRITISHVLDIGESEKFMVEVEPDDLSLVIQNPSIDVHPGLLGLHTEDLLTELFYWASHRSSTAPYGFLYDLALVVAHELQENADQIVTAFNRVKELVMFMPYVLNNMLDPKERVEGRTSSDLIELGASADERFLMFYGLGAVRTLVNSDPTMTRVALESYRYHQRNSAIGLMRQQEMALGPKKKH